MTSNGQTRTFSIGDESFYGTRDLYVKDDQSNEVFLVDDAKLRNIRQARTSLPDRSMWSANVSNITQASLEFQSQHLPLTRKNWQDRNKAAWTFTEDSTKDATQIETWIGKLLRVSVSQYAKPTKTFPLLPPYSRAPSSGTMTVEIQPHFISIRMTLGGLKLGTLVVK